MEEFARALVLVEQVVVVAFFFLPWEPLEALVIYKQLVLPISTLVVESIESSTSWDEAQLLLFVPVTTS